MDRDQRLRGLSSDHHHALVLARTIRRRCEASSDRTDLIAMVRREYEQNLAPHFQIEENLLLPALVEAGGVALATQTRSDHALLKSHLDAAMRGDSGRLLAFARLLEQHIRFEERTLFPACESRLDSALLDEVMASSPPPRARLRDS